MEGHLSRADVSDQTIATGALALDGAEEASLVDVVGAGVDLTGHHRRLDAGITLGAPQLDVQLAGRHLQVLASDDIFDVELARHHADVQIRSAWDLDGDLEVVVRAAIDFHSALRPGGSHPD